MYRTKFNSLLGHQVMVMIAKSDKSVGVKNRKIQSTRTLIITPNFRVDVGVESQVTARWYRVFERERCKTSSKRDKLLSPLNKDR